MSEKPFPFQYEGWKECIVYTHTDFFSNSSVLQKSMEMKQTLQSVIIYQYV
jgi:hypothetical protein